MALNYFKTAGNVLLHPITAYNNLSKRTGAAASAGASFVDALKYGFTPQTAYAAENPNALDYSNSPMNPIPNPPPPNQYPYNAQQNSAAAFPELYGFGSSDAARNAFGPSGPVQGPTNPNPTGAATTTQAATTADTGGGTGTTGTGTESSTKSTGRYAIPALAGNRI